jgi:sarcosine oxidase subunit beta
MVETADVVVIGAGVVGASVAYHLVEAGCGNVLVVERRPEPGAGSTGRATGGVRAQFGTEINIRMSQYSIDFFSRFKEATGFECGYEPVGYLFFATSAARLKLLEANRKLQIAAGLKNVDLLSRDDIRTMVPQMLLDDVVGGTFCPTDGLIDPPAIVRGFLERARSGGVRLWTDASVSAIEVKERHVARVQTTKGAVSTRIVVNAAGAWSAGIAEMVGVDIPVTPLRRQLVATAPVKGFTSSLPMVIDVTDGFHFRRLGTSEGGAGVGLLLAWPDPDQTPGFNEQFDEGFIPRVLDRAVKRLPTLAQVAVDMSRSRAGLYEMTPDHHAIIGRVPEVEGFYLATGFSGHGVMHSPATGRIIAEMILEGQSNTIDATSLALERFREDRLIEEKAML